MWRFAMQYTLRLRKIFNVRLQRRKKNMNSSFVFISLVYINFYFSLLRPAERKMTVAFHLSPHPFCLTQGAVWGEPEVGG